GFARRCRLEIAHRAAELEQSLALAVVELAHVRGCTALQGGSLLVHDVFQAREAPFERARGRGAVYVYRNHIHRSAQLSHRARGRAVSTSGGKSPRPRGRPRSTGFVLSLAGRASPAAGLRRKGRMLISEPATPAGPPSAAEGWEPGTESIRPTASRLASP